MTPPKAIVFDLDETLYRERRFALGGFAAVSCFVMASHGIAARDAFHVMVKAMRAGHRGTAFQVLCDRFDIPRAELPSLVEVFRTHTPRLRLPASSAVLLAALRPDWRLGLLTNGLPSIQKRKVAALGLTGRLDHVVFAPQHGCGTGKPDPVCFREVLNRLDVTPERAVFVGDDLEADVIGARRAGMSTIRICRPALTGRQAHDADVLVDRMDAVPAAATALLEGRFAYAD